MRVCRALTSWSVTVAFGAAVAACGGGVRSASDSAGAAAAGVAATAKITVLVASKQNAELRLVDPSTGAVLATLPTGRGPHEIAVAPDRSRAVVANYGDQTPGNSLTVVSLADRTVSRTIDLQEHKRPHGLSFLPSGRLAVTSEMSQALLIVDLDTGTVTSVIKTNVPGTHMVVTSRDGRSAYTTNIPAGSVSFIDVEHGTLVKTADVAPKVEGIALTPDGRELWVGSNEGDSVHVLDALTLETRAKIAAAGLPIRVTATPDGKTVIVTNANGSKLQLFDTHTRELAGTIDIPAGAAEAPPGETPSAVPIGTVVTPDSRTAYVSLGARGEVAVVDLASRQVTRFLPGGEAPDGIAIVVQ